MVDLVARMLTIKTGNLLNSGADVIIHQVNCLGVMGTGVARQIRERWPEVYKAYQKKCAECEKYPDYLLGHTQIVPIGNNKYIANVFGQLGYGPGCSHTVYDKLESGIIDTIEVFLNYLSHDGVRVGMPWKIGCGLAGGNWRKTYDIIEAIAKNENVEIELWKLPEHKEIYEGAE